MLVLFIEQLQPACFEKTLFLIPFGLNPHSSVIVSWLTVFQNHSIIYLLITINTYQILVMIYLFPLERLQDYPLLIPLLFTKISCAFLSEKMSEEWEGWSKVKVEKGGGVEERREKSISSMWKLILIINLTGPSDAQIFGLTLVLDVFVTVLLEEISVWIDELSKADCPLQCGWPSSGHLRPE